MPFCKETFKENSEPTNNDHFGARVNAGLGAITGACSAGFVANLLLTAVGVSSNPLVACAIIVSMIAGGRSGWATTYRSQTGVPRM